MNLFDWHRFRQGDFVRDEEMFGLKTEFDCHGRQLLVTRWDKAT